MHNFNYIWNLSDIPQPTRGKVFSCFACGGGSTMGYKLAGFNVVGCNELDPRMTALYEKNLHPRYMFVEDIRDFVKRNEYPQELYNLDILDGSPPCSSFSMCGAREKKWGVEHKFKEGQKAQVLDTLFFDFIALSQKLQPKCVVAENVLGLKKGNAKKYFHEIVKELENAGYYVSVHVLDASRMGVPQKRKRLFFICLRKDLIPRVPCSRDLFTLFPQLNMDFGEEPINFEKFCDYQGDAIKKDSISYKYWELKRKGERNIEQTRLRVEGKGGGFQSFILSVGFSSTNNNCRWMAQDDVLGQSYFFVKTRFNNGFIFPTRL